MNLEYFIYAVLITAGIFYFAYTLITLKYIEEKLLILDKKLDKLIKRG